MDKKFLWLILALTAAGILFFVVGNILADVCGDPPSSDADSSEGAWYDEAWVAYRYYNLEASDAPNFVYKYTTDPTTAAATANPDLVVTEWQVRGHVHFASSGL